MNPEFSKTKHTLLSILVAFGIFLFGIYIGSAEGLEIDKIKNLAGKETAVAMETDFSPFWKVWNALIEKHPDAQKISDTEKINGAIAGLVNSFGDPYSVFFDKEEAKVFEENVSGNFSGVGMEVGIKENTLTVIAPLKNTPAFLAGLKSGDIILKIDEKDTTGLSLDEAIKLIRGEKGTSVTLSIFREGFEKEKDFTIIRDIINVPVIETELRGDKIFVIRLYSFNSNSVRLFRNALQEFSKAKTDKLLLDLRGNPGGYLDAAVDLASWFLPAGKVIVTEDYGDKLKPKIYRSYGYDAFNSKLKFVILIDGGSASASEILAGAMQDHGRALLVGTKSFGKGSVQEVVKIADGTLLKVTVAKWLTPNGKSISETGLSPDYEVTLTALDVESKNDLQTKKAVELLNNWPK